MIKVYVTGYWESDQALLATIRRYGFGEIAWKNIEFTINPGFDIAVILNHCNPQSLEINYEKSITFRLEPPDSSNYVAHSEGVIMPGYMHWPLLHKSSDEHLRKITGLSQISKSKVFSTVTSDLYYMPGHIRRLNFIHNLSHSIPAFEIWGRNTTNNFFQHINGYKGELHDKFDGLIKYKYHLAVENSFIENYYTEKITDALLAECLCFYDGCTNIEDFIDPRAFLRINLKNTEEAKDIVIRSLKDNIYNKQKRFIDLEKRRLLSELNPLNLIWAAVNQKNYNSISKL